MTNPLIELMVVEAFRKRRRGRTIFFGAIAVLSSVLTTIVLHLTVYR